MSPLLFMPPLDPAEQLAEDIRRLECELRIAAHECHVCYVPSAVELTGSPKAIFEGVRRQFAYGGYIQTMREGE